MEEAGREPKSLENRPELPGYLMEYIEAFYSMSGKRSIGFSAENPISTADIVAYLQLYPTSNVDLFVYLIGEMDNEYLKVRYDKPGKKTPPPGAQVTQTNVT